MGRGGGQSANGNRGHLRGCKSPSGCLNLGLDTYEVLAQRGEQWQQ